MQGKILLYKEDDTIWQAYKEGCYPLYQANKA
jgi:hypothetical protein